mgnify:CR=1 FL=1
MLKVRDLKAFYGRSQALFGMELSVGAGEVVTLIGRNGMGKSTLLKSLIGLVKPRQGEVLIKGHPMTAQAPYRVAQMGIAYVPEGRGIFGNLSVKAGNSKGAGGVGVHNGNPIRFLYSDNDGVQFDFMVYITSYTQPGSQAAVRLSPEIYSPTWTFTFFIYQDNSDITLASAAQVASLNRVAGTFGWFPTQDSLNAAPGQFPKIKQ